ncbi:MAG: hypothetical protein ACK2UJ_23040 [Candidatus Promineifilaceae bacterium]
MNARHRLWYLSLLVPVVMLLAGLGFILATRQREAATGPQNQGSTAGAEAASARDGATSQPAALVTALKPVSETLTPTARPTEVPQPPRTGPVEEVQAPTETQSLPTRVPKPAGTLLPTGTAASASAPTTLATATGISEPAPSATGTPFATDTPAATLTAPPSSLPAATARPSPSATAAPPRMSSPTPGPQESLAPMATARPLAAGISGRVLFNGQPVEAGLVLVLEDADFKQVQETTVEGDGGYQFVDMAASDSGYNVTFSWARNQAYDPGDVIAWGWIGPVAYDGQSALILPDLEIALLGLEAMQPEPDTSHSAASISPAAPLSFAWSPYPTAERYWVDIEAGPSLESVWRSQFVQEPLTEFEGELDDGTRIQPGVYWWAVGSQSIKNGYRLTISGQRAGLRITP